MTDAAQLASGLASLASQQTVLVEDADFVPQLAHVDTLVLVGDAAVILQTNALIPLPVGCRIDLVASNVVPFTVDDSNVTVNSKGAALSVAAKWSAASLVQTDVDVWLLAGDLA